MTTKRPTETDYLKQARAAAKSLDGNRWELACIAAEMKAAGISQWDVKLANLAEIRRSARTVREWATAYNFKVAVRECGGEPLLPFSFFARASRYVDTVPFTSITELMDSYAAAPGANFESFCSALSELAEPDGYHDATAVMRRTAAVSERIGVLGHTLGLPTAYYTALADAQAALAAGIAALEAEVRSASEAAEMAIAPRE